MSQPFLGEIRMVSFNFATKGFALCNGQTLPVAQNQALFSLLGTFYGGNGQTTFNLPNLQGRSALHFGTSLAGSSYTLGQQGGEPSHLLSIAEMPAHNHVANVSTAGGTGAAGNLPGVPATQVLYDNKGGANAAMNNGVIGQAGAGVPHENRMPFLAVNFIIALQGIYPTRN